MIYSWFGLIGFTRSPFPRIYNPDNIERVRERKQAIDVKSVKNQINDSRWFTMIHDLACCGTIATWAQPTKN